MKSCWITYQGKQILYGDFRDLSAEDLALLEAELGELEPLICRQAEHSLLMICDIRGSVATTEAMVPWKSFTTHIARYVHKLAVLGVSGFKKVLFDALVRLSGIHAVAFEELEQAQAWLVE